VSGVRFRGGNFNGFAGKYDERFWSTEVLKSMKSETPSTKPGPRSQGGDSEGEITNKSQIPISNDQNRFGILVIVICPSTWLRVVSPSTLLRTVSLSNGLSNH
jgi:hypothetical protein